MTCDGRNSNDQDEAIKELVRVAFSDIRELLTPDGCIKPPGEWDEDAAAAVEEFTEVEHVEADGSTTVTRVVKLWDKNAALESLGRHWGAFEADTRQHAKALAESLSLANLEKIIEHLRATADANSGPTDR